jgi:hypothetical protein
MIPGVFTPAGAKHSNRTGVSLAVFVGPQEVIPFFPAAYPSRLVEQHQVAMKRTRYSKTH